MCKAKLVSKESYQSQQYGNGVEYKFFSEQIGEYKTKKKDDDVKYNWLKSLPIGGIVDLKKNPQGKGYLINQESGKVSDDDKKTKADLLADCFKAMSGRLPELPVEEQVKLGISLFIQLSK
jgi:hypothetical protein